MKCDAVNMLRGLCVVIMKSEQPQARSAETLCLRGRAPGTTQKARSREHTHDTGLAVNHILTHNTVSIRDIGKPCLQRERVSPTHVRMGRQALRLQQGLGTDKTLFVSFSSLNKKHTIV